MPVSLAASYHIKWTECRGHAQSHARQLVEPKSLNERRMELATGHLPRAGLANSSDHGSQFIFFCRPQSVPVELSEVLLAQLPQIESCRLSYGDVWVEN